MEQKNPILNFRKKNSDCFKKKSGKANTLKSLNHSTMITKTRESIDMTEHS